MKIGYLCSDVDVQLLGHEGCSVHIREFTNALVETGHDPFIICNWLGGFEENRPRSRVYQLDPQGANRVVWDHVLVEESILNNLLDRDLGSVLWNALLQTEAVPILEREKPDFLYERYALFGTAGLGLARRFGIPLILELNAPLCDQQLGYDKFPLVELARKLEAYVIRHSDAIVALTPWLADWAVGLGASEEKIQILPDAVSGRLFGTRSDGSRVRQRLELEGREVIGFVGGFHRWHDIAGLIDAFKILYQENPQRRLLLVGAGHTFDKMKKRARTLGLSDVIHFAGRVPHSEVPGYMAAMDVAVVPYKPIEDFFFSPMKLFESMAAGRPIVAANLGQIPDIVRHGETGWLYSAGNQQELVEGLRKLLENKVLAANMGSAARDLVLHNHTWEKVTSQVVEIATRLIDRRSPGRAPLADGIGTGP